ncbi:MAG: porin [Pseudomonadota bacterium]
MKKIPLLAIALGVALTGTAQAQSSVTVYGAVDAGLIKRTGAKLAVGKRDANTLGFKGSEDLGSGLKAIFQLEMRYEPDTGTVENGVRPLFQGQSRVGLAGGFGMLRIGRGVPAYMESITAFEPFHGLPTPAGFYTDIAVAGYTSQPLDATGNSFNRMSNALFYNSMEYGGFQVNATVATKEANNGPAIAGRGSNALPQYPANAPASANPFSISGTYKHGMLGALLAYERNGVESTVWSVAASVKPVAALKLMASYADQDRGHSMAANETSTAWVVGANYTIGNAGTMLLGYGRKMPDGVTSTRQWSLGYEYPLSKRTYLYADASDKKTAAAVRHVDLGMRASF